MTTHDEDQADGQAVTYDPLAALRIDELDTGSRQLRASLVAAITERTVDYERGLAVVAWLHARREDPAAKLAPFLRLTFTELSEALAELAPDEDDDGEGPTAPGPA